MAGIIEAISAVGSAVSNVFAWSRERQTLKNQTDVKAAAMTQQEIDAQAAEAKIVADKNLEEARKRIGDVAHE